MACGLFQGFQDEMSQFLASVLDDKVSFRVTLVEIVNKHCHVHFKVGYFKSHINLEPRPDWSPLGVNYKCYNEHPGPHIKYMYTGN